MKQPVSLLGALFAVLMLTACGGGHRPAAPQIDNPYHNRAVEQLQNGREAMLMERWRAAELSFSRALDAAQLTDDLPLTVQAWYHLGLARAGDGSGESADEAFARAEELAGRYGDEIAAMRARLALALNRSRGDRLPADYAIDQLPASLFSGRDWPIDLQLQAGRLAQRLGNSSLAESAYRSVVARGGADKAGMKIRAEAHMGLALLARDAGDEEQAVAESESALALSRELGGAHLIAHALLFQGGLSRYSNAARGDRLERAEAIYASLSDRAGERRAVAARLALAESAKDTATAASLRLRLQALEDKLGQSEAADASKDSEQGGAD